MLTHPHSPSHTHGFDYALSIARGTPRRKMVGGKLFTSWGKSLRDCGSRVGGGYPFIFLQFLNINI